MPGDDRNRAPAPRESIRSDRLAMRDARGAGGAYLMSVARCEDMVMIAATMMTAPLMMVCV